VKFARKGGVADNISVICDLHPPLRSRGDVKQFVKTFADLSTNPKITTYGDRSFHVVDYINYRRV
jgi:hypothetical protein